MFRFSKPKAACGNPLKAFLSARIQEFKILNLNDIYWDDVVDDQPGWREESEFWIISRGVKV